MLQDAYVLDKENRAIVLASIERHCAYRGWNLLAAHVRSNHLHIIVESRTRPKHFSRRSSTSGCALRWRSHPNKLTTSALCVAKATG